MVVCEYDEMDLMDLVGAARLKAKTFVMLLMSDYILDFWYSQQQQHHVTQLSAKTLFKDKRVHEFTMLKICHTSPLKILHQFLYKQHHFTHLF